MAVSDKGHGEDLVWGDAHNDPRAWCLFHPLSTPFMLWSVHQQSGGAPSPDYIHIMEEGRGGGGGRGVIGWMFGLRDRGVAVTQRSMSSCASSIFPGVQISEG